MKKTISILLTFVALVGVLGVFAISASAAESFAEVKELKGITLWNAATGEVINFDNGTLKNGTPVRCWALDGTGEQLWNIVKVSGTTYRLVTHKSSKYCLDVYRGSAKLKAGQKCDIWKTGDDPTAQNIVFTRCENGNYVITLPAVSSLLPLASRMLHC